MACKELRPSVLRQSAPRAVPAYRARGVTIVLHTRHHAEVYACRLAPGSSPPAPAHAGFTPPMVAFLVVSGWAWEGVLRAGGAGAVFHVSHVCMFLFRHVRVLLLRSPRIGKCSFQTNLHGMLFGPRGLRCETRESSPVPWLRGPRVFRLLHGLLSSSLAC